MSGLKYMVLGLGILLFAICMYVFGISLDSPPSMFLALFSQIIGVVLIFVGFFKKE